MEYVGLDVHKRFTVASVWNDDTGEIFFRRIDNSRKQLEALFSQCHHPHVVLEAGWSAYMVYDTIEQLVEDIQIANPLQVKAIAWAAVKTDKVDAQTLCALRRADLIPQCHIRSRDNRNVLYQLRQRMFFVKTRTMVKNRIHVLIDRQREEVRNAAPQVSDLFGKAGRHWLDQLSLPQPDARMLKEMLGLLDSLERQIKAYQQLVTQLWREDPVAQRLSTIPGIGKFLAVLIRAEIDDITRFPDDKRLHAYAGLVPTTSQSGGRHYQGRLPRSCNHWLRWAMVEAVFPAITKDLWLKHRHLRLAKRKAHNVAKIATARLLLTLVYKIWTQDRPYSPLKPDSGNHRSQRVAQCHS